MLTSGYLVPEDFNQRNMELIQSIRKYLHNDESKFNQFKNYSAQFRQVKDKTNTYISALRVESNKNTI